MKSTTAATKFNNNRVPEYIAVAVVFVCGVVIIISGIIICGVYNMYKQLRSLYMSSARGDSEAPEQPESKFIQCSPD